MAALGQLRYGTFRRLGGRRPRRGWMLHRETDVIEPRHVRLGASTEYDSQQK